MKKLFKLLSIFFVTISINAMEYQGKEIVTVENKNSEEPENKDEANYFDLIPDEIFADIANCLVIGSPLLEDIKKNCINWKLTCKRCNKIKPVVNKEVVEYLSEKIECLSPLDIAVKFDLLQYVTNALADNDINSYLSSAVQYDSVKVAELLLKNGASVNAKDKSDCCGGIYDRTPLHFTAEHNSLKVAELLLKNGASVNAENSHGHTPLHIAAECDSLNVAKILLEHGACIDPQGKYDHYAPLHFVALNKNSIEVAELLLKNGAPVNAKDSLGMTPLRFAAGNGLLELAELLLKHEACVNVQDQYNITPLHCAVKGSKREVIKLLLNYGADIALKDERGRSPVDFAKGEVKKLLESKQ